MPAIRRAVTVVVVLALLAIAALVLYGLSRGRPQDLPWTPLDLGQPIGLFTARKIAALTDDLSQCRGVLDQAGIDYMVLPPRRSGENCGYDDAVRLGSGGPRTIGFSPAGLGTSCAVAAGLAAWEWHIVNSGAERHFGSPVRTIDHFGSYSCRRLYGRDAGSWSEHATADAVDIAGFRLADGRRISVVNDWNGGGEKAAFLREVRDGACRLFGTTLSPDYNAAHRDHLHLDMAKRAMVGGGYCR